MNNFRNSSKPRQSPLFPGMRSLGRPGKALRIKPHQNRRTTHIYRLWSIHDMYSYIQAMQAEHITSDVDVEQISRGAWHTLHDLALQAAAPPASRFVGRSSSRLTARAVARRGSVATDDAATGRSLERASFAALEPCANPFASSDRVGRRKTNAPCIIEPRAMCSAIAAVLRLSTSPL